MEDSDGCIVTGVVKEVEEVKHDAISKGKCAVIAYGAAGDGE